MKTERTKEQSRESGQDPKNAERRDDVELRLRQARTETEDLAESLDREADGSTGNPLKQLAAQAREAYETLKTRIRERKEAKEAEKELGKLSSRRYDRLSIDEANESAVFERVGKLYATVIRGLPKADVTQFRDRFAGESSLINIEAVTSKLGVENNLEKVVLAYQGILDGVKEIYPVDEEMAGKFFGQNFGLIYHHLDTSGISIDDSVKKRSLGLYYALLNRRLSYQAMEPEQKKEIILELSDVVTRLAAAGDCEAEVLDWMYDSARESLQLSRETWEVIAKKRLTNRLASINCYGYTNERDVFYVEDALLHKSLPLQDAEAQELAERFFRTRRVKAQSFLEFYKAGSMTDETIQGMDTLVRVDYAAGAYENNGLREPNERKALFQILRLTPQEKEETFYRLMAAGWIEAASQFTEESEHSLTSEGRQFLFHSLVRRSFGAKAISEVADKLHGQVEVDRELIQKIYEERIGNSAEQFHQVLEISKILKQPIADDVLDRVQERLTDTLEVEAAEEARDAHVLKKRMKPLSREHLTKALARVTFSSRDLSASHRIVTVPQLQKILTETGLNLTPETIERNYRELAGRPNQPTLDGTIEEIETYSRITHSEPPHKMTANLAKQVIRLPFSGYYAQQQYGQSSTLAPEARNEQMRQRLQRLKAIDVEACSPRVVNQAYALMHFTEGTDQAGAANVLQTITNVPYSPSVFVAYYDNPDARQVVQMANPDLAAHSPWYRMLQRLRSVQDLAEKDQHCPWKNEINPLVKWAFETELLRPENEADAELFFDFMKEYGAFNLPKLLKIYVELRRAKEVRDVSPETRVLLEDALGARALQRIKVPAGLLNELRKFKQNIQEGLLEDAIPGELKTTVGIEIFNSLRGQTMWGQGHDFSKLISDVEQTRIMHPERARVPEGYVEKTLEVRLVKRKTSDEEQDETRRITKIVEAPEVRAAFEFYQSNFAADSLFRERARTQALQAIRAEADEKQTALKQKSEKLTGKARTKMEEEIQKYESLNLQLNDLQVELQGRGGPV